MFPNLSAQGQQRSQNFDFPIPKYKQQARQTLPLVLQYTLGNRFQPTQNQLCQAIVLIKKVMPNRSLQRAITMMQHIINTNDSIFPSSKDLQVNFRQPYSNSASQFSKTFPKVDLIKKSFTSFQQQIKYKQKRLVAKSFVARGYGIQFAIEQFIKAKLNSSLLKDHYKRLISSVVSQAFRKLQNFLISDCLKNITPLSKLQLSKVITHLISSTHYGDKVSVFKKFIRYSFGLSDITLCQKQTLQFYASVVFQAKGIPLLLQNFKKTNLQEQIAQSYTNLTPVTSQQTSYFKIQDSLRINHPQNRNFSEEDFVLMQTFLQNYSTKKTFQSLSSKNSFLISFDKIAERLNELFKIAIKKLLKVHSNQLFINQSDIHFICKSQAAELVRIHLIKFLLNIDNLSSRQILNSIQQTLSSQKRQIFFQKDINFLQLNGQQAQAFQLYDKLIYQQSSSEQKPYKK